VKTREKARQKKTKKTKNKKKQKKKNIISTAFTCADPKSIKRY